MEGFGESMLVIGRVCTIIPLLLLVTLFMGKRSNGKRHSPSAKPARSYCALYGSIMVNLVPTRGLLDTLTVPPIA